MAFPEASPRGYPRTDDMGQSVLSKAPSLDALIEHCKEKGEKVEITGHGPGQSSARKIRVQGGGKYVNVEEDILSSTPLGRELLRNWAHGPTGSRFVGVVDHGDGQGAWWETISILLNQLAHHCLVCIRN
ncbi:hypothetical protein N657DRAFT_626045 [Parathielavia appendiculata]|uniref:Uncharacterized protein n=1 Tax=Parathielavia appendiculata TaxID=2587402 RepID=A0AAN6TSQ2_9PEZI|nr:hypothetical protein N657DRAFT_626045 [Parathielavia appendiculata]